MSENMQQGSLETTPTELARMVQILAARGSGRKPQFGAIGLSFKPPENGGDTFVFADHRSKMDTGAIRAEWYSPSIQATSPFSFATDQPDRLLDYVSAGLFEADKPVWLVYESDAKRIVLTNGSRRATMATIPFADVPRFEREDAYGTAPGGLWVTSAPDRRPEAVAGGENWDAWTAKGYSVVKVSLASLAALLSAGGLLYSRYDKTVFRFTVDKDGLAVVIHEPKDPTADTIEFGRVEGSYTWKGTVGETFSVLYTSVEPALSSLRLVKAESVILVHHPEEKRVNILVAENTDSNVPVLRMTESFMSWKDSRGKKGA